jgi:NAD(P)H-dependent flavin oxidoreductase YrpB (nitropropane dioxygenase family)
MFKTRVTELLGIEYPIMQGAMTYVSCPELAAAVSNAGGLGTLTSADCQNKKELRDRVRKTKSLTNKPFAVNLSLFPMLRPVDNDEFIDVLLDEGVQVVETSGVRAPDQYIKRLKEGNIKCIHKCTLVRHALSAQKAGADAITVVGFEQGGAMGPIDITTFVLAPLAVDALDVPILVAGGIGDARGFAAALSLGAEGIVMGTRFLITKESPIHLQVKDWILKSTISDTAMVMRSIGNPHRVLRNAAVDEVLQMEMKGATIEELAPLIGGKNLAGLYDEGDLNVGMCYVGEVVELIRDVKSCEEVIGEMVSGARQILTKLSAIASKA